MNNFFLIQNDFRIRIQLNISKVMNKCFLVLCSCFVLSYRYLHKPIQISDLSLSKHPYPYRTVGCVFNHKSFYANIQVSMRFWLLFEKMFFSNLNILFVQTDEKFFWSKKNMKFSVNYFPTDNKQICKSFKTRVSQKFTIFFYLFFFFLVIYLLYFFK